MKFSSSVYSEKTVYSFVKSLSVPSLRKPSYLKCIPTIFYTFFFRQYCAAFLPGRVPVSNADHPLDEKIPFDPSWDRIYFDFIQFWIRMLSFFLRRYRSKVHEPVKDFILSIGELYKYASIVYRKNLSTTKRPFYLARPRFFIINLVDPHLMCVPSLHVMIAIHTYKMFEVIAKQTGDFEKLHDQFTEMKQGALAICHSVLFIKQHSVNCLPAALYAMTCFHPGIFSVEEAEDFIQLLFSPAPAAGDTPKKCRVHPAFSPAVRIIKEDQEQIKSHILELFRQFISEKETAASWDKPILKFLQER